MDTTFITIHDLSPDARVLYASDSIVDILGHTPDEVVNHSCWDFFHPDELPVAKELHGRGLKLDKAAVLAYCSIKNRQGEWVCCECCFTVVYDVMVVCTSIYRPGMKSQKRAVEAPIIRRLFSSSPKDPRYHMLTHLSGKFQNATDDNLEHEPRAALFLNRFTRTLTIMYATSGLYEIIGITGEELKGRSFYYCIAENCLQEAVNCLENAKGNDSIAYLRFWFRDPRQDDQPSSSDNPDSDEEMTTVTSSDESHEGGVNVGHGTGGSQHDYSGSSVASQALSSTDMEVDRAAPGPSTQLRQPPPGHDSRTSSGDSVDPSETHASIFGHETRAHSSSASSAPSPNDPSSGHATSIELEAVVSCTSDGLVVCLRRARPVIPHPLHRPAQPTYANGLFAAPWAIDPIMPRLEVQPFNAQNANPAGPTMPQPLQQATAPQHAFAQQVPARGGGPAQEDFMASIRETAIFAWALTGINGSLAAFGRGKPTGDSQPPDGFPIWAPHGVDGHGGTDEHTGPDATANGGSGGARNGMPGGHAY